MIPETVQPTPDSTSITPAESPWQAHAGRRWPRAVWIRGDGPHALVTPCRQLTVSLYADREAAERARGFQCGGACFAPHAGSLHVVVDLRERARPGRRHA